MLPKRLNPQPFNRFPVPTFPLFMFPNASTPYDRREFYFWNLWAPSHVFQFNEAAMQVVCYPHNPPLFFHSPPHTPAPAAASPHPPSRLHLQSKLATYLLHASQVPSLAWIEEFLRFIGTRTPHPSVDDFAEGFQFYN